MTFCPARPSSGAVSRTRRGASSVRMAMPRSACRSSSAPSSSARRRRDHRHRREGDVHLRRTATARSLTLRPEGTASVVRAYVEHALHAREPVAKLYYLGPMFRRERPQKGRLRQFSPDRRRADRPRRPAADAEMLAAARTICSRELGVTAARAADQLARRRAPAGRPIATRCVACGAGAPRRALRELHAPARAEPAAHPRLQGARLRRATARRAAHGRSPLRALRRALRRACASCSTRRGRRATRRSRGWCAASTTTAHRFEVVAAGLGAQNARRRRRPLRRAGARARRARRRRHRLRARRRAARAGRWPARRRATRRRVVRRAARRAPPKRAALALAHRLRRGGAARRGRARRAQPEESDAARGQARRALRAHPRRRRARARGTVTRARHVAKRDSGRACHSMRRRRAARGAGGRRPSGGWSGAHELDQLGRLAAQRLLRRAARDRRRPRASR